jgi:hypothetical protein
MAYKDNLIDTEHLKTVDLTVGDFRDLVTVLEGIIDLGLVLPDEATAALARLTKRTRSHD